MELSTSPGVVAEVTAEQVRRYTEDHSESEYQLIDVRQPEEYTRGHIPGAVLIPLGELEAHQNELLGLRAQKVVFTCRSGARSMRAATWASATLGLPEVFNLSGGFIAWNGLSLAEAPRLKHFDLGGSVEALLHQAMNLEKGTHRLYERVSDDFAEGPAREVLRQLAQAELGHGRLVHQLLSELSTSHVPSFESLFEQASSDLVESGESYETVVARAKRIRGDGEFALLELALEIELSAYDLYKSLAARWPTEPGRLALLDLAQQEKTHAAGVLQALSRAAAMG